MYLATGYWPGEVLPKHKDDDGMCGLCGICHERPAAWGDWMCRRCRAEFEAKLRWSMDVADEVTDGGLNDPEEGW